MAGTASAGPSKVTYVFTNITLSGANHLTFGYVAEGNDHYIFNSGIGFLRRLTVTLPAGRYRIEAETDTGLVADARFDTADSADRPIELQLR